MHSGAPFTYMSPPEEPDCPTMTLARRNCDKNSNDFSVPNSMDLFYKPVSSARYGADCHGTNTDRLVKNIHAIFKARRWSSDR